ncbi:hypothetical protein NZ47_09160 [Anaerovibrio lipolyticus]|uniref:AMP-binding protein n=2 Tax=Anaerovibrio lipolyticus TaxID=82374 RepID=A0A0B2JTL9_9FIRM|nr:fatty acid--CoA ligase family protein [Anaerovibrio lipolyticus]KHM51675.1 hypothetical protein NZ47_09160 [Anaerovibrio lipolyticus]
MMEYFWQDEQRNILKSREEFIEDLRKIQSINLYNCEQNPYDMMLQLVASMLYGKETYLLDDNFSASELLSLGISATDTSKVYYIDNPVRIKNFSDIVSAIQSNNWRVWLFTSGTTGLPKKVCHGYGSLGRNVRYNERHNKDVWAFAYKMSHMAGVQVLLQALVNNNTIVYIFEDSPQNVVKIIKRAACTNISATPTFYRNLLPFISEDLPAVKHITLGGEKYDENLCNKLHQLIPGAKIHNIYASTETGSILASHGNKFSILPEYKQWIKISPDNELCIHKSLLGDFSCADDWYNTHDLVEIDENGFLRFLSRKSDLINVGGYKVNPLEVENLIQQVDGVEDCLVKGKKNSVLGSVLEVDVVVNSRYDAKTMKTNIMDRLKKELQPFKIPRIYHFVETIEKTRSGKKVRK